jgi:hypothetical protein
MALAMAAEALAQAGRSRDDVAGGGSQESSAGLGMVRKFSSVSNVRGLLLDHKADWKFESGQNFLTDLVLSRAGPKWANFDEIRSIRAESQNLGCTTHSMQWLAPNSIKAWPSPDNHSSST